MTQYSLKERTHLVVIATAPIGEPGDEFFLVRNFSHETYKGVRADGSPKRIWARLQDDSRTLEYFDVPPGVYSIDTKPVSKELFTWHSFLVSSPEQVEELPVLRRGQIEVQVGKEWHGAAWMRILCKRKLSANSPQCTGRLAFDWQGQLNHPLLEGEYELLVQLGSLPPISMDIHVVPDQKLSIEIDPEIGNYPVRLASDGSRKIRRVVVQYRGVPKDKGLRQRTSGPLPSGGIIASNHKVSKPEYLGLVVSVDPNASFDLGLRPEETVQIMAIDEDEIWSQPIAVTPNQFQPEQELILYPQWGHSLVLNHPNHWGPWSRIRASGDAILDQYLKKSATQTVLNLEEFGDIQLKLTYFDASGSAVEQMVPVYVDGGNTTPHHVEVSVPERAE